MIHTIIAHELCEVECFVRIQPLLSKTIQSSHYISHFHSSEKKA